MLRIKLLDLAMYQNLSWFLPFITYEPNYVWKHMIYYILFQQIKDQIRIFLLQWSNFSNGLEITMLEPLKNPSHLKHESVVFEVFKNTDS